MNDISNSIEEMVRKIDNYCRLLVISDYATADCYKNSLEMEIVLLIYTMIKYYDYPEFEQVKNDKNYWSAQIERVHQAMGSLDVFFTIDVLKHETSENMKLFLGMLS